MRVRKIDRLIRQRIEAWIESVDDEELRKKLEDGVVVTGGALTSLLTNEEPNDYDVYLRTPDLAEEIARFYVEQFVGEDGNAPVMRFGNHVHMLPITVERNGDRVSIIVRSAGVASEGMGEQDYEYFECEESGEAGDFLSVVKNNTKKGDPYRPVFLTENAITLEGGIQIVVRFSGEPEKVHETYDFVHCKCAWVSWKMYPESMILPNEALLAILDKRLVYHGSLYPLASLFRLRKFIQRGWKVSAATMAKIGWDISRLDLSDPGVLRDQLTGMDIAYFYQVIEILKAHNADKDEWVIDEAYFFEVLDEVFGE